MSYSRPRSFDPRPSIPPAKHVRCSNFDVKVPQACEIVFRYRDRGREKAKPHHGADGREACSTRNHLDGLDEVFMRRINRFGIKSAVLLRHATEQLILLDLLEVWLVSGEYR